jgi:virginiamycin B lyase
VSRALIISHACAYPAPGFSMTRFRRALAVLLPLAAAAGLAAAQQRTDPPGSSDILALLPDGEMKRSFILDCTGCHQMDAQRAFAAGQVRTAAQWQVAIERMLQMAGPSSSFPVISARVDAAALSRWLATHIDRVPTGAARTPNPRAALREYDYPYPADLPHDLRVDASGRVVITGMFTHRMLVLDPETAQYDEVPIPVPGANPRALDFDAQGRWWVLLGGPNRVAVHDPRTGEWTSHHVGMYGHSIGVDARGRVWFNGHFTKDPEKIGYVEPATGEVTLFDLPTPEPLRAGGGPIPYELRIAPDGSVWITELQGNRLVRLDPATGAFEAWTMPITHAGPRRIDIGPDGIVWIPAYSADRLMRFDPRTGSFTELALPLHDAVPYVVRVDQQRGTVWIGLGAGDAMLSFDPATERFESYPLPTRGALIRHIDIDARDGTVWAAYGASPGVPPRILRISPQR